MNPFGVAKIREAVNMLIDRDFIIQEIFGGLGAAKYSTMVGVFPDYARYIEVNRALEAKYAYTRIETRRWQGEPYRPLLRQRAPVHNGHTQPSHITPAAPPVVKVSATGPLFMQALDGYLRESPRTDRFHAGAQGGTAKVRDGNRRRSASVQHRQVRLPQV